METASFYKSLLVCSVCLLTVPRILTSYVRIIEEGGGGPLDICRVTYYLDVWVKHFK